MAIQSFYISINISAVEKETVLAKSDYFTNYKKCPGDLIYKSTLYIDNITFQESWWHINAGLYDFFHSCEVLYELCQIIETIKPNFIFCFLGKQYNFSFHSLMEFIAFIYPEIEKYKMNLEENYGVLSVHPQKFFTFRRKNNRFFK